MTKTGTDAKNNEAVKPQTASETAATETTVADTVGDDGAGVLAVSDAVTGARVNNLQNIDVTIPRNTLCLLYTSPSPRD